MATTKTAAKTTSKKAPITRTFYENKSQLALFSLLKGGKATPMAQLKAAVKKVGCTNFESRLYWFRRNVKLVGFEAIYDAEKGTMRIQAVKAGAKKPVAKKAATKTAAKPATKPTVKAAKSEDLDDETIEA